MWTACGETASGLLGTDSLRGVRDETRLLARAVVHGLAAPADLQRVHDPDIFGDLDQRI